MSVYNLVRNSRIFFTTNLTASNAVALTGHTATTTKEIQVLAGYTFGQTTTSAAITISEAGSTPTRGQRNFNNALGTADFTFSTYIRPSLSTINAGMIEPEERFLWNALVSPVAIQTSGGTTAPIATITAASRGATSGAGSDILTFTCTASGLTTGTVGSSSVLVINEVVTLGGLGGTNAQEWNIPARVVSADATTVVVQLLKAPSVAAGTSPTILSGTANLLRSAWTENAAASPLAAYSSLSTAYSNVNQLQAFGLILVVDGITYTIDNAAMDTATIDFGLTGIATVAWVGKGTALNSLATATTIADTNPGAQNATVTFSGGITGTAQGKYTGAPFITNKLSTVSLVSNIAGASGTAYNVAITGGNIVINNTLAFVTPTQLGVVNKPIGYYTGTRAITGNVQAYMKTGSSNTSGLLQNMLANIATATETKYSMVLSIGGASNPVKVELDIPGVMLSVPTVATGDLITTTINFTAEAFTSDTSQNTYDIGQTNEIQVRYYSNV